jgi:hypothetical protein
MPRKQISIEESIKLNKFVERRPDRKDEQFFYFGIWWNVSKMLEYIHQNGKKPVEFSMAQLAGAENMVDIDEEYALTVELSKPGIIIDLTPKHMLLVDGNHRFYRAKLEDRKTFLAYHLTLREQTHFITDKDGLNSLKAIIRAARANADFVVEPACDAETSSK